LRAVEQTVGPSGCGKRWCRRAGLGRSEMRTALQAYSDRSHAPRQGMSRRCRGTSSPAARCG